MVMYEVVSFYDVQPLLFCGSPRAKHFDGANALGITCRLRYPGDLVLLAFASSYHVFRYMHTDSGTYYTAPQTLLSSSPRSPVLPSVKSM